MAALVINDPFKLPQVTLAQLATLCNNLPDPEKHYLKNGHHPYRMVVMPPPRFTWKDENTPTAPREHQGWQIEFRAVPTISGWEWQLNQPIIVK